jgi:hypothetical protein
MTDREAPRKENKMNDTVYYMIWDGESGNAIGSYDDKEEAIIGLDQIVQGDNTAKDEFVIMGYDKDGLPTEVMHWVDTLNE